jgi:4-amino-4-deoxy-L-arabinose transferase-like glycosyltransferase
MPTSATGRRAALVVLGGALLARLGVLLATEDLPIRDDSVDYIRLGRLIADGKGFGETVLAAGGGPTAFRPPAYPIFLGAVFRLTGDSVIAARLVQVVLGVVTVALIGIVARQLFDRRQALVAAGLAAVYPPLILTGNAVLTEALSLPLQMLVLAACLRYRQQGDGGLRLPALCGLLVGLCILTRPANIALLLPACLLVMTTPRARRGLLPAGVVAAAAVVALAPWQIRNQAAFDAFVPITTADGFVLAGVYNAQADGDPVSRGVWRVPTVAPGAAALFEDPGLGELGPSPALRDQAVDYALDHPSYVPVVVGTNLRNLFDLGGRRVTDVSHNSEGYGRRASTVWLFSYGVVALGAIAGAVSKRARSVPLAVWLIPVLFVLVTIPTLGTPRYRAPIEPFLVLLASLAVTGALDRWSPSVSRSQRSTRLPG